MDKAYISKNKPNRGIIIHLHGCAGLHVDGWIKEWMKHFEKSGYKVSAPDSFAIQRPPAQCGTNYKQKPEVFRVRREQLLDAISLIRNQYPDKKVYIWGHSEGGQLLQSITLDFWGFFGALVTGHSCGFGRLARVYLSGRVPLLVLNGSENNDPFLRLELNYKAAPSMKSLCTTVLGYQRWKWLTLDDYGHILPIWEQNVREAVYSIIPIKLKFSGATSSPRDVDASRYKITKQALRGLERTYRSKKKHKAFAIGPDGSWGYNYAADSSVDAVTMALFWCNEYSRKARRSNNCAVYDINDFELGSRPSSKTSKVLQAKLKELQLYEGDIDGRLGAALSRCPCRLQIQQRPCSQQFGRPSTVEVAWISRLRKL